MDRVFVSRENELRHMERLLGLAMGGEGQVCFVTGEAGFGKTSLTSEFARRAEQQHDDLLAAIGDCNSQTGVGDPYLPFREVLGMLAGDVDDRVAQGMTTEENANRLRDFLRVSKRIIKEVGPDLIDIFIPGVSAVTKAGAMVMGDDARTGGGDALASTELARLGGRRGGPHDGEQSRIFEQVTKVFVTLAQQRPLILVLDDLHWIDDSSASLLFHLARRIEGSRILIVGTYRPEEVALKRGDARHPMAQIVPELKRLYGDVLIELTADDEDASRGFVDQLLDSQPNELGAEFRDRLYRQTLGHPLFTIELLQDMRERGALLTDANGRWVEGPQLDWDTLPARAEGAIEERINRLEEALQEILSIASVQGEVFTAQVVAELLELKERQLLTTLTQQLGRVHRLISEEGSVRIGTTRISDFRFRHQLFQKYLYERLGESERQLLHEDVACALETLFADHADQIAVQLAFHFSRAGIHEKAAAFYLRAGQHARTVFAYREAATLARHGITSLERSPEAGRHNELSLELRLLLGEAHHHAGNFAESLQAFRETADHAVRDGAADAAARAAIGYSEPGWRYNLIDDTTARLLRQALAMFGDDDNVLRARLLANLARATQDQVDADVSMGMIKDATEMAKRLGDPRALIDCLRLRLNMDRDPDRIRERIQVADEAMRLSQGLGDKHMEMESLAFGIYDRIAIGDVAACNDKLQAMREIAARYGDPFYIYHESTMRAAHSILEGDFAVAERLALTAMQTGQKLGVEQVEGVMGLQMFTIRREQGRLREIAPVLEHFVNERGEAAAWRPGLTLIYADLGRLDEARSHFDELAQNDFSGIARDSLWQTCLCYLAEVCVALGDEQRAGTLYRMLSPYAELALVVGNVTVCLGASSRILGQLAAATGRGDDAETHFEHALEMNQRMNARPWLAHTRYQYARLLNRRGGESDAQRATQLLEAAGSDARALGMSWLAGLIERAEHDD